MFLSDEDRRVYLEKLQTYMERCGFELYAYVLMDNHVHLLMETRKEPISRIMQLLNFTYTQYFNRKYGKVGHLFQGRYKSYLCDKDSYLLALVRYIHMNPVRAEIVDQADVYPWSSHGEYLGNRAGLCSASQVLRLFSGKMPEARRLYREFMAEEAPDDKEVLYQTVAQQIVGGEEFIEEMQRKISSNERILPKIPLEQLLQTIEEVTGIDQAIIVSRKRSLELRIARSVLAAIGREMGYTLADLSGILKRDISVVSNLTNHAVEAECRELLKGMKSLIAQTKA
ncbi:MAG: transposase [Thermodesulfovibrionales bacterium]